MVCRGEGLIIYVLFVLRRFRSRGSERQPDDISDGVLIDRAQNGDLDAFNLLVDRYRQPVYSVALRYMRSSDLADDVVQDTFIRGYNALDSFQNEDGKGFRAWLLRIAVNRSLDILRSQSRRPADSLDAATDAEDSSWQPEDPTETPVQFSERGDLSHHLEHALTQLPDEQRLVIILSDIHGYSHDEISEIAGVAAGTVKSRLHRGRARLREILLASPGGMELFSASQRLASDDERG